MANQVYGPGSGRPCAHGIHASVAVCRECRIDDLTAQVTRLTQDLAELKRVFPWHRTTDRTSPDVPVLQPRYDALREEVARLTQERDEARFICAKVTGTSHPEIYKSTHEIELEALLTQAQQERDVAREALRKIYQVLSRTAPAHKGVCEWCQEEIESALYSCPAAPDAAHPRGA